MEFDASLRSARRQFLSPRWGLLVLLLFPRLTPWALFFRRFAAKALEDDQMASSLQILPSGALRRIHRIQTITIAWMSVEAVVALTAAWRAHSPALAAFGGDSAIELLSAGVVLWRFRSPAAREAAPRA